MNWSFGKSYTHCSDEELMQLFCKGNHKAFELLYERYSAQMYRFFYRMMWQNKNIAEDFTQDIFIKIIENPQLFDTQKKFKSWLFSIAANKCKNAFRDKKTYESIDNQGFMIENDFIFSLDKKAYEQKLSEAIASMSIDHKACFVLRFFDDLSIKEMSSVLDIPEGTVKSRLFHATKKIAETMQTFKDTF